MVRNLLHIMFIFFVFPFINLSAQGRILMEYWDAMKGTTIPSFISETKFPNNPSSRMFLSNLEIISNVGDNYGVLIRGYISAPATGNYNFWIAADDLGEVWLSTDHNPSNKRLILSMPGWSNPREWTKYPGQKSNQIFLTKGHQYYIEVIYKENKGNDNLAIGWTLPDGTMERPIQGRHLIPYETINTIPPQSEILSRCSSHPRLHAGKLDFILIKQRIASDATVRIWHKNVKSKGDKTITLPIVTYHKADGVRLLEVSRTVLERIINLGYLYNAEPDTIAAKQYAERAWLELQAAANFPDWNPSHFLDVAEMTHAFALGYDLLFPYLSASRKTTIKNAIINKGFLPFLKAHNSNEWWTTSSNNWNIVCNTGIALGALAIGDEVGAQANNVLSVATNSLKTYSINTFGPDGGYDEGPMYWAYSTKYLSIFLAALENSQGGDFGLAETPGILEAGSFPMYLTGTTNKVFNFSDGVQSISSVDNYTMFYLSQKFNRPEYGWFQRIPVNGQTPYNIIWYNNNVAEDPKSNGYPTEKCFSKVGVATMRGTWNDNNAAFVGFKAGNNAANHSNLDNGTFVFDALGQRWAVDLGKENYNLSGMFNDNRWNYYRLRAEGQNTLVINPDVRPDQDPIAIGKITNCDFNASNPSITADLTPAYISKAQKVTRKVTLQQRRNLLIQDNIQTSAPVELFWFMHTEAAIAISSDGKSATLTLGNQKCIAKIIAGPTAAKFSIMEARPMAMSPNPSGQNQNTGIKKLAINLKNVSSPNLTVSLEPVYPTAMSMIDVTDININSVFNKNISSTQINLFPIPAQEKISVQLVEGANKEISFSILDLFAKEIEVTEYIKKSGDVYEISVENLKSGLYILLIKNGSEVVQKKFKVFN